jgi:hypothetical protein
MLLVFDTMSYIDHSLAESEAIIYRARFPWFYRAGAWCLLVVFTAAGIAGYANGFNILATSLFVFGLASAIAIMLPIWTTEIGVTNQRLVYKRGLLWRTTHELQLRAIEEVNLIQGLLGRLLDFGRLELHGTGVDDVRLPLLADPLNLRKALQDGMAAAAHPGIVTSSAPVLRADGVLQLPG